MHKIGKEMYSLMERLFPICRSITGNGVRETLKIIREYIPINNVEITTGTKVLDWEIPNEWNINDAYIKTSNGDKIVDFNKNNLHVLGYSEPFEGKVKLEELKNHIYTLPDQPDLIPYVTSYYKRRWGFCLSEDQFKTLKNDMYEIKIDSALEPGNLTYADLIIKGKSEKEILISTYICHPSLANNELSGPVISTFLAKYLLDNNDNYYSYRFVFAPETIGTITYLSKNLEDLKRNMIAGYVLTCIGDSGPFSYLQSKNENTLVDRVTMHVLKHTEKEYKIYDYLARGSDERQYCSPGIDLPVGSLMRTKYGEYPEYHTSGDNMDIISSDELDKSLDKLKLCINIIENNRIYKSTVLGEPQLGKRGLYPTISTKTSSLNVKTMMNILAFCDGRHDLLWIAEKINEPIMVLVPIIKKLLKNKLLEIIR
jgi:aminopeptidase-like protein